jgi:hypothetical protein
VVVVVAVLGQLADGLVRVAVAVAVEDMLPALNL